MTLSCWVKPNRSQIGPLLKKINPTHGYRINVTATGALRFVLRRNGQNTTVTSTVPLPLNKWTHVAARYDGKQMRIFINGTLDAATTPATAANTPRATTAPVLIGGDSSTHRFSGTLDDVSIYGRALSDSEIADLANIVDKRYQYHHVNALGSNIVLTDDNQKVLVRYEYDVFGAIRSETGTCDNTRKFTGKEFDADSNLYYYAARYYDPYIGRFTQRDPIGDGVNWYAYAENNPLKFVDPTGQFVIAIPGIILVGGPAVTVVKVGSAVIVGAAIGWWLADQSDSPDSPSESESDDEGYTSIDDFIDTAKPIPKQKSRKKTRGRKHKGRETDEYDKTGEPGESGWDKANDDFDRLVKDLGGDKPKTYRDKPRVRSSRLPDGTTISVRPDSGRGKPTIQIDAPKTRGQKPPPHRKVRYNTHGG